MENTEILNCFYQSAAMDGSVLVLLDVVIGPL